MNDRRIANTAVVVTDDVTVGSVISVVNSSNADVMQYNTAGEAVIISHNTDKNVFLAESRQDPNVLMLVTSAHRRHDDKDIFAYLVTKARKISQCWSRECCIKALMYNA